MHGNGQPPRFQAGEAILECGHETRHNGRDDYMLCSRGECLGEPRSHGGQVGTLRAVVRITREATGY